MGNFSSQPQKNYNGFASDSFVRQSQFGCRFRKKSSKKDKPNTNRKDTIPRTVFLTFQVMPSVIASCRWEWVNILPFYVALESCRGETNVPLQKCGNLTGQMDMPERKEKRKKLLKGASEADGFVRPLFAGQTKSCGGASQVFDTELLAHFAYIGVSSVFLTSGHPNLQEKTSYCCVPVHSFCMTLELPGKLHRHANTGRFRLGGSQKYKQNVNSKSQNFHTLWATLTIHTARWHDMHLCLLPFGSNVWLIIKTALWCGYRPRKRHVEQYCVAVLSRFLYLSMSSRYLDFTEVVKGLIQQPSVLLSAGK